MTDLRPLIGPTTGRMQGERVPINIHPHAKDRLLNLLYLPEMRGVGFTEFIMRACEVAETEIVNAHRERSER